MHQLLFSEFGIASKPTSRPIHVALSLELLFFRYHRLVHRPQVIVGCGSEVALDDFATDMQVPASTFSLRLAVGALLAVVELPLHMLVFFFFVFLLLPVVVDPETLHLQGDQGIKPLLVESVVDLGTTATTTLLDREGLCSGCDTLLVALVDCIFRLPVLRPVEITEECFDLLGKV